MAGLRIVKFKFGMIFKSFSTCNLYFATNVHGSPTSSSLREFYENITDY